VSFFERMSRREFFRSLGRYGVLGALAAGGAVAGRRGINRSRQKCVNKSVCCNCKAFDDCRLPAALSAKDADASEVGGRRSEDGGRRSEDGSRRPGARGRRV
jgi:hypothetical protein